MNSPRQDVKSLRHLNLAWFTPTRFDECLYQLPSWAFIFFPERAHARLLSVAAATGNVKRCKLLLTHGARPTGYVNAFRSSAYGATRLITPFTIAVVLSRPDVVQLFLEAGADPNDAHTIAQSPSAVWALKGETDSSADWKMVGHLLWNAGGDPEKPGTTPNLLVAINHIAPSAMARLRAEENAVLLDAATPPGIFTAPPLRL